MPKAPENLRHISSIVEIVSHLRGPEGCPWDKEQTHESLTQYAIEEVHEFVEAVETKDPQKIKDELGDVLFQVILHAQLAQDAGHFTLEDVVENISKKLIRRHSHVFGDVKATSPEEVRINWEKIKAQEKAEKLSAASLNSLQPNSKNSLTNNVATLSAAEIQKKHDAKIPLSLPALQRALEIGYYAQKMKFEWDDIDGVFAKIDEEYQELHEAIELKNKDEMLHEFGDLFFSIVQLAKYMDIDPEQSLRICNRRFEGRFSMMLELCEQKGLDFVSLPLGEKEKLWAEAKALLKRK